MIVPFAAGSTPDLVARLVGERLGTRLGQPVIVDNKPGASGNIGTNAVAKAAPDGKTLGIGIASTLAVNALLYKKMPYDPARDIELITVAASQPAVLVASSKFAADNATDLLAQLKKNPGKYSFASIGAGSASHLAMQALAARASANLVHVPYPGSGAAVAAIISGEVDMGVLPAATVMPFVKSGRIKALAIASSKRSAFLPQLPTLAEVGAPEIQADAWIGIVAPARTPPEIVKRLSSELVQILTEPSIQEKLHAQYMEPVANTPTQFRSMVNDEVARWKPVIEKNSITLD
ncbi:tripartite tricarboxylate transporter substrate binding protein [Variovorax beijingensis]|uniref:Tripartite tricarboxylate transporter substrate binding protein n=1 Tax=Variovorax beijingensis TaxID=2496117 RepID=A0ABY0A1C5_9BURK|nr:tripartite tricarboxylate transporter substrate binding protein [Variovorax beijingensis]